MDICFDEDIDTADAVEGNGFVEMFEALGGGGVGLPGEVGAVGAVFFVACFCSFSGWVW